MRTDPIPSSDNNLANMLQNLGTRLAPLVTTLGMTAADATAITTDATALRNLVLDQQDKQNAAKSATAAKDAGRATIEKRSRATLKRIKSHANYTPAIGEQLGIVGSGAPTVAMLAATSGESLDDKPQLKLSVSGDGTVTVKFAKRGHTGVLLYGRRGSESEFVLLAKQFRSPYIDDRDNLAAAIPETREYLAQFFETDTAVGQRSDTAAVTVPGDKTTVLAKAA